MNDQNLKDILQKYQPKAPAAPFAEFNKIQSRLNSNRGLLQFRWFYIGGMVAASVMAFFIFNHSPIEKTTAESVVESSVVQNQPAIQPALSGVDADIDLMMEEWPTLDVGADYLELASN